MNQYALEATARALVARGKGILAADESLGTIKKRFARIDVDSTEELRRAYRELLFTTPGVESFIGGVILYDETIRQADRQGKPFPDLLAQRGMLPGIKADKGTADLAGFPGEKITEGLDGLRERLIEYRGLGATFAKWHMVLSIGPGLPTRGAVQANALELARYAALCQEEELVPIIEPEVLMEGDHSIGRAEDATTHMLQAVFEALAAQRVFLEGLLLKTNMVLPGLLSPEQANPAAVAEATLRTLRRTVPAAVPGIVFLSGGQSPVQATENLNAINQSGPQPWELSFSYARALQEPVLDAWRGEDANVAEAQARFYERARLNALAREGQYMPEMEPMAQHA